MNYAMCCFIYSNISYLFGAFTLLLHAKMNGGSFETMKWEKDILINQVVVFGTATGNAFARSK